MADPFGALSRSTPMLVLHSPLSASHSALHTPWTHRPALLVCVYTVPAQSLQSQHTCTETCSWEGDTEPQDGRNMTRPMLHTQTSRKYDFRTIANKHKSGFRNHYEPGQTSSSMKLLASADAHVACTVPAGPAWCQYIYQCRVNI